MDPFCDLWEPYGFVEAHGKQGRLLLLLLNMSVSFIHIISFTGMSMIVDGQNILFDENFTIQQFQSKSKCTSVAS